MDGGELKSGRVGARVVIVLLVGGFVVRKFVK